MGKLFGLLFLALGISAIPLEACDRYYVVRPEVREVVVVPQVREVVYVQPRPVVVMPAPCVQPVVCYAPCRPQPQVQFSIGGGRGCCHRSNLWWNVSIGSPCCY